ncbi:MAG: bifunctional glutamate N-acetyltransferase/amino-acid acetyltransferase ArgJ [Flexistipes sinusarabici]|uniref:Arginine biosynthesis bifunctional protein ArgJ n=1 Tax=Flexistipes sinusarabici TaxID=2352 RepID=A0A5D0MPA3_FLESI|nr:bifunctional glutamate N-acetyltransferase/amino-acid acetyltransferase ArgJ [Flexistipes sinusarabici]TYB34896.1 MAG: bifunctional glutamate N-acetyltransferase/amino-acid acetyltransferase ArgJ [Flexistipes sinusarabici]
MNIIKNAGVCAPLGFSSAATAADIKGNGSDKLDYGILVSMVPCEVAAVFTKNNVKAPPLIFAKERLASGNKISGILVNSGNANACTGKEGLKNCRILTEEGEKVLELDKDSLLISSTGVIGEQLPINKMKKHLRDLPELLTGYDEEFAECILTTDTRTKRLAVLVETDNGAYVIGGVAKGSGMISPDMATMLSFITTDAMISEDNLKNCLNSALEESFNSITVDGDMSTNDSVFIFANGLSGININMEKHLQEFQESLNFLCKELAKEIVKDGEGATKFVTIRVKNAVSKDEAKWCGMKIANSPLVKTMFFGEDPNWGRLMACTGASLVTMHENKVDIYFNNLKYVENGVLIDKQLEKEAADIMSEESFTITIDLNIGNSEAEVYTSDLSYDYVKINADYRT